MTTVDVTADTEVNIVQDADAETIVVLSPDDVETIQVSEQGPPGPPGPPGPIGAPSNVPGPPGPVGITGPPGPVGPQGPLGGTFPDAPSDGQTYGRKNAAWTAFIGGGGGGASILVSDTAPVGAPSNALWWESDTGILYINYFDGDSTAWVMVSYAVPGPQGAQGIQGNQGPPGPSGVQGNPGAASTVPGPAGPVGPKGDKGDIGNIGPQGPTGAASTVPGPQGPQGVQGVQGDVGPPGPKGDKGDQGNVGPAGPAGAGSGNVNGPAGAVANDIVVFDGTTGTLIKDSGITIAALAPLASPTFTGDPKAPTPAAGDNDTSVATTEFVNTAIAAAGTGQIFYLDLTDAADVSGYKRMLLTPSAGAENSLSAVATGTTADFLIGSFITDVGIPGAIQFPAGSAYRRLYGKVSGGTAKFHLQVYIRSAAGVETLARDEFSNDFTDTVATLQEWLATPPASGALATTDRLVAKISARRVTGPTNVTVTLYGEGNAHASQIQTTISPSSSVPISATPPLSITGGNISINLSAYAPLTYVDAADALRAPIASPTFTGDPKAPTPAAGDNDTSISTTAFVNTALAAAAVRYDVAQVLTAAQQQRARQNAYAAPFDALGYFGLQINGAMEVSQEVAIPAGVVPGAYVVDGWQFSGPAGTVGVSSGGFASQVPAGFYNAIYGQANVTPISVVAGTIYYMVQSIEGVRIRRLMWGTANAQPLTIAFWSSHTVTGLYSVALRNGDGTRSCVMTYTHAAADTPQYNVLTFPGCIDGTWKVDNTGGVFVSFALAIGSTYIAPSTGGWVNGNYLAGAGQVNGGPNTASACRITGVLVLPGNEAPSAARSVFIMRPYDQELIQCMRYLEVWSGGSGYCVVCPGVSANASEAVFYYPFKVQKRSIPALGISSLSNFVLLKGGWTSVVALSSVVVLYPAYDAMTFKATAASGLTASDNTAFTQNAASASGAKLIFDARL